jgi:hypothetical protein
MLKKDILKKTITFLKDDFNSVQFFYCAGTAMAVMAKLTERNAE